MQSLKIRMLNNIVQKIIRDIDKSENRVVYYFSLLGFFIIDFNSLACLGLLLEILYLVSARKLGVFLQILFNACEYYLLHKPITNY